MIGYVCKYAPLEIFEAMGTETGRIQPQVTNFNQADTLMHPNVCSFAKAVLEEVMGNDVYEGLVLTTCCDSMRRLYDNLKEQFPGARVLRMDFDTTREKDSYEKILSAFANREADILVGTQMIVKGHDFPDVTLVGVIAADLSLNMDDYHCGERTFQLLTQAVGRSGRGDRPGHAVIQTYQPEHYSIQAAAIQDYEKFYKEEMGYRMLLDYPPAARMMTVFGACQDEELLKKAMYYIEVFIRRVSPKEELHMIGPASASVGKVKDVYRQVLHLKHTDIRFLTAVREKLEKYIEINSGFRKIYIQFDMN